MKFPIALLFWRSYNIYVVHLTHIVYSTSTYIVIWRCEASLKNRKSYLTYPHFMERSASVANIKCVNSNLLGIYDFRLLHMS
jgi:hypothetical protein